MTTRLRNAQIRLNALLVQLDVRYLYQGGPTRRKILNTIAEHGELKIENERLRNLPHPSLQYGPY